VGSNRTLREVYLDVGKLRIESSANFSQVRAYSSSLMTDNPETPVGGVRTHIVEISKVHGV